MVTIQTVTEQEQQLQFDSFSNQTALALGAALVKLATTRNNSVTIDITRNRQQLFHAAMPGTAIDNDAWLQRKINTVYQFGTSSLKCQLEMEQKNQSFEDATLLDHHQFAAAGGAFPVTIKGTGVIGTIAVSGLESKQDHQLIIDCLQEFLPAD